MRRDLATPTVLQRPGSLLWLAAPAPDAHGCDIVDVNVELGIRFHLQRFSGWRWVHIHPVLLHPDVDRTAWRYGYNEPDVQRATSSGEIVSQPTHRTERICGRDGDRGPAVPQCLVLGHCGCAARPEDRMAVQIGLGEGGPLVGSASLQRAFEQLNPAQF